MMKLRRTCAYNSFQDCQTSFLLSSAFMAIPDSATSTGDVVYSFKSIHNLGSSKIRPIFGYTFFRQAKDASLARGFLQKSVVLLSYHNDVNLFKEAIRTVGNSYFQYGEPILEAAWLNIRAWPAPKLNSSQDLPILVRFFSAPPELNVTDKINSTLGICI